MNIDIHIERLLLDGIDATPRQLSVLKSSFESHLAHLLAKEGIGTQLQQIREIKTIYTDPISSAQHSDFFLLGERIARSVHGGLRR